MTRPGRRFARRAAGASAMGLVLWGAAALVGCNSSTEPPAHVYYVTLDDRDSVTEGNNFQAELSAERATYDFGDTMRVHLELRNIGVLGTTVNYNQRYDITVDDLTDPHRVFEWSQNGPQQQADLPPESTLVAADIEWDMRDSLGAALPASHQFVVTGTPFQIIETVLPRPRLTFHTRTPSP